jgi:hypothetical protein
VTSGTGITAPAFAYINPVGLRVVSEAFDAHRRFTVAWNVRRSFSEWLERAEQDPSMKMTGIGGAVFLALAMMALLIAQY